jgi:hypothetical protein
MANHRVIVAQPASLCREGDGLLQLGVLRWMLPPRRVIEDGETFTLGAVPVMTFAVKATFSYADCASPGDEMTLASEPEGLSLDVPCALDGAEEDEIACPSDFVPLKRLCDVLVTGHVSSRTPRERIPAGIQLGSMSRRFLVEASPAAVRAPLLRRSIRQLSGSPAEPVGPGRTPGLLDDYPLGFDFATYNTASPSQQVEEVLPGAPLTLTGLCERAEKLALRLPRVAPVMWVDTTEERGIPVELPCDTVWIDTDRRIVVLGYRMILRIPSIEIDGVVQATLALARDGVSPRLEDVRRDLARGAFEAAVELSDFGPDAEPSAEEPLFARFAELSKKIEPQISLETYALVAAALAEGKAPREDTLRAYGFDEHRFLIEERGWLTRMSEEAMRGDPALATRYGELFVEAQDGLAGPGEGKESILEYVALKVDVEDADDPMTALSNRKMTFAEWMRMDRRWTRKALQGRALELEIERMCAAYRASKGEG